MKRRTALTPPLHLFQTSDYSPWLTNLLIFCDISACLQLFLDHVGIRNSLDHVSVHSVWDGMCTNRSGTNTVVMSKQDDTRLVLHTQLAPWPKCRFSTTAKKLRVLQVDIYIYIYKYTTIYYIHTYICIPSPYAQSLAYATLALRLLHLQDLLQLRAPAMTNPRRCTDHVTHQGCAILLGRARGMHARISNFWASLRGFWYQ